MKKIIKILSTFFILINIMYTTVYCNMTIEAMEKSRKYYEEHKFIIDFAQNICYILELQLIIFVIIIPFIIIYKKIKLKKQENVKDKKIVKTLGFAEILFISVIFCVYMGAKILNRSFTSEQRLHVNIFVIIVSLVSIGIVIFRLLKVQKNKIQGVGEEIGK